MNYLNGVTKTKSGIHIRCDLRFRDEGGVILFSNGKEKRVPVSKDMAIGNHYDIDVKVRNVSKYDSYLLYEDKHVFIDPYSKKVTGLEEYGVKHSQVYSALLDQNSVLTDTYKVLPKKSLSFSNSVFYGLHVRGFTKLSGMKECGTFLGLSKEIPYLKDLGVTTIVLMPAYEFDETENNRINYWGYKEGFYFCPKNSYAYGADAALEFRQMVHAFHENQMEVIMQMYFPDKIMPQFIMDVLCYWTTEYHVDGFHLLGNRIPIAMLAAESRLADTKLLFCGFPMDEIQRYVNKNYRNNLAVMNDGYMSLVKRYVKGDYNTAEEMVHHIKYYDERLSRVCYLTKHDSMTLFDSVMYEKKHNENNGEENRDGTDYNDTWNCGVEGITKKRDINALREKQRKNMMTLLMLTSSTPMLFAGDECLHTQNGNNNPYCQDNKITWMNWEWSKAQKEWFDFVKELIAFRKEHSVFCGYIPFLMVDRLGSGIPDLSVHSDEAWKSKFGHADHSFGLMYGGALNQDKSDIYVAYNMDWERKKLALPSQKGKEWHIYYDTSGVKNDAEAVKDFVFLEPRSIQILMSKEV